MANHIYYLLENNFTDMQNYLRRFTSDNEYEDFLEGQNFTTPNVSMIKYDNDSGNVVLKKGRSSGDEPIVVFYNPYIEPTPIK